MFKSKEDILDGMYRIFSRRGYAASMAELAKAAAIWDVFQRGVSPEVVATPE